MYRDSMDSILQQLNERQREAVEITQGPLLVVAGAGSGKTKMLTVRIAYLIEKCGVPPEKILAVTFTNKAAKEMRERVRDIVDGGAQVTLTTFHSFCCQLLRRWQKYAGYTEPFTIYDESDSEKLMKNVLKELNLSTKAVTPKEMLGFISNAKNELVTPEEYHNFASQNPFARNVQAIYQKYQEALMHNQAADFDDLIFKAYYMLKDNPELLQRLQEQYEYFLVDEYQDTNHAQYKLVHMLSSASRNICVVGDEDQSIYSWRGANIRNIQDFAKDFAGAKVVKLEQNYRSTQVILDAAGAVISRNASAHPKKLWTDKEGGEKITFERASDDREEAAWIARKISALMDQGYAAKDFAILFRMNSLSRPIEQVFQRLSIPYDFTGGTRFFERREVKDIMAYLRVLNNSRDGISLERIVNVPKRGIGQATIDKLYNSGHETLWLAIEAEGTKSSRSKLAAFYQMMTELREDAETLRVSDLCSYLISKIKYFDYLKASDPETADDRKSNIESLVADIRYQEEDNPDLTLHEYLEISALHAATDNLDESADRVHLMTLHNAKGLEFPVVFLVAMEEGIFPHHSSKDDIEQLEEERRLAYVGMTRAREQLLLSASSRRMIFGGWSSNLVSRFVAEVPTSLFKGNMQSRGTTRTAYRYASTVSTGAAGAKANLAQAIPGAISSKVVGPAFPNTKWSKEKETDGQPTSESGNMKNLIPGAKVSHISLGYGIVYETSGDALTNFKVTVDFETKGRKHLALQYTTLRVLKE
jgi:DNA helicase-2/ATP-dependent DNA helicase PcrA